MFPSDFKEDKYNLVRKSFRQTVVQLNAYRKFSDKITMMYFLNKEGGDGLRLLQELSFARENGIDILIPSGNNGLKYDIAYFDELHKE